jgi:crossover junction endodeoxyribonuclease RuvC
MAARKIILGIDPGIADTGYGVLCKDENGNMICRDYGSIKTPAKDSLEARLETLNVELERIIDMYNPEIIAVEQLFFCKNVKTALLVGQARGVILLTARKKRVSLLEFTPLQVKQAVSTYGRAGKMQVQRMVKLILALDEIPQPDDAADALAVALCAAARK